MATKAPTRYGIHGMPPQLGGSLWTWQNMPYDISRRDIFAEQFENTDKLQVDLITKKDIYSAHLRLSSLVIFFCEKISLATSEQIEAQNPSYIVAN